MRAASPPELPPHSLVGSTGFPKHFRYQDTTLSMCKCIIHLHIPTCSSMDPVAALHAEAESWCVGEAKGDATHLPDELNGHCVLVGRWVKELGQTHVHVATRHLMFVVNMGSKSYSENKFVTPKTFMNGESIEWFKKLRQSRAISKLIWRMAVGLTLFQIFIYLEVSLDTKRNPMKGSPPGQRGGIQYNGPLLRIIYKLENNRKFVKTKLQVSLKNTFLHL